MVDGFIEFPLPGQAETQVTEYLGMARPELERASMADERGRLTRVTGDGALRLHTVRRLTRHLIERRNARAA